jgi:hypothetical protein
MYYKYVYRLNKKLPPDTLPDFLICCVQTIVRLEIYFVVCIQIG